jgi:hypothetical protein
MFFTTMRVFTQEMITGNHRLVGDLKISNIIFVLRGLKCKENNVKISIFNSNR